MDEQVIDLGYLSIAGKFWGPESGEPTIALHGYLDNANSFDLLAPALEGLRIFAMDFAGHGLSEHRRAGEQYSGLNDIRDVLAVADQFGWRTFNIIGHSMGAEIGSQLAGLFPDRVNQLICIDGYCGVNNPTETLNHFASTITASFKAGSRMKVFPDFSAMAARLCEATGQTDASARCLIERGHMRIEGGYTWRTDPRIRGGGPFELTTDQLHDLLDRTRAETLFIVADAENAWLKRTLDVISARQASGRDRNLQLVSLPAHHHLHMQGEYDQVARLINEFTARDLARTA